MSIVYLKIKIKALAAEAAIIRHEERKLPRRLKDTLARNLPQASWELRRNLSYHRRGKVREEARCAQLAYAFLRAKKYAATEPNAWWTRPQVSQPGPDWTRVRQNIVNFSQIGRGGGNTINERAQIRAKNIDAMLVAWREGAEVNLEIS